jgi:DNA repair protein RecO (recombination protein O)
METRIDDAIVLRHLDYGEADRIVTFFTPRHGRLKGFARGARKSRKRFGPALEPFAQVRLSWSPPRSGDLAALKEAELVDLRAGLRADLVAVALAGYGCELLEALLGDGPEHPRAFDLLRAFLDHLAARGGSAEARLLFELRLLAEAGYSPHLLHCSACGGKLAGGETAFDIHRGGSLCPACAGGRAPLRIDLLTLGTLARCLRAPVVLFDGVRLSPRTLSEGRALLAASLEQHLHRPLKSLSFLERMLAADLSPKPGK